jgi:hypothetical protein
MVIMQLLEHHRVAKDRHRRLWRLDMRVIIARPQTFPDDLDDALAGAVWFAGEALAVDKNDVGGHRG